MNPYTFYFEDKNENILEQKVLWCTCKKEAIEIAKKLLGESMDNDLFKIRTRKTFDYETTK